MAGDQERRLVAGDTVGSWTGAEESWWQETKRGSWSQESREAGSRSWRGSTEGQSTPDTEQRASCGRRPRRAERQAAEEKLVWKNGGAVNTRHRAERRGDKIGSSEEESQDV